MRGEAMAARILIADDDAVRAHGGKHGAELGYETVVVNQATRDRQETLRGRKNLDAMVARSGDDRPRRPWAYGQNPRGRLTPRICRPPMRHRHVVRRCGRRPGILVVKPVGVERSRCRCAMRSKASVEGRAVFFKRIGTTRRPIDVCRYHNPQRNHGGRAAHRAKRPPPRPFFPV